MQTTKSLTDATGMSESEAKDLWHKMPHNPFRTLMEYEFETRKLEELRKLATVATADDFRKQQGVVEGIEVCIGILNRKLKI